MHFAKQNIWNHEKFHKYDQAPFKIEAVITSSSCLVILAPFCNQAHSLNRCQIMQVIIIITKESKRGSLPSQPFCHHTWRRNIVPSDFLFLWPILNNFLLNVIPFSCEVISHVSTLLPQGYCKKCHNSNWLYSCQYNPLVH